MSRFEIQDITIRLVDVAEQARQLYGEKDDRIAGRPIPPTDLRLEIVAENETRKSTILCSAGIKVSAEDILAFVNREW